ncbi:MAG: ATP-binding cassette domain-containing protein, partial [Candidatus Bipolaricaulota bacterium]
NEIDRARVQDCLHQVGLAELADRPIAELSGGQQQRMFIARALAQQAELILMDEPLAGLDAPTQKGLLALMNDLPDGPTLIVALHELAIARDHFPRILLLRQKVVGLGTPADVFTPDRLRDAYGESVQLVETPQGTLVVTDTCCPSDPEREP